jgi:hypothetical protein
MANKPKTRKLISSLPELRFKLAELWSDIDERSVELSEANVKVKIADVIVKSIVAEGMKNKIEGVVRNIDFIEDEGEKGNKLLIDEFKKAK